MVQLQISNDGTLKHEVDLGEQVIGLLHTFFWCDQLQRDCGGIITVIQIYIFNCYEIKHQSPTYLGVVLPIKHLKYTM